MVPKVDAFLLGAPKCGTTWLAEALTQHPRVCVSNPKEPNIIASHKGTFLATIPNLIGRLIRIASLGMEFVSIVLFMHWPVRLRPAVWLNFGRRLAWWFVCASR